jgi:hypothetical protein
MSCERITIPVGDDEVRLQTDKFSYTINDTIKIYLINTSDRPVYSHPPGDWVLYKKFKTSWDWVFPLVVPTVLRPPRKYDTEKTLVAVHTCAKEGEYRIQMYLSWDEGGEQNKNLGLLSTPTFKIKGT